MNKIKRALVSVSDKEGIVPFVEQLRHYDIEILSTGGTAATLRDHGIPVAPVEDVTGMPEMLGGRVKTLHPRLHGGILAQRDKPEQMADAAAHGLPLIDLVVVNLYPFEAATESGSLSLDEALSYIDIGGVAMLRAAAKNFAAVTVACAPCQYDEVVADLQQNDGATSRPLRQRLALETFRHTAAYDAAISAYLHAAAPAQADASSFAERETLVLRRERGLRYGENPHQDAALYASVPAVRPNLIEAQQLHGKELSFNNLADADAALAAVKEFDELAVVILKHQTPCGVAVAAAAAEAYERAHDTDPDSASGGVISCNREVDAAMAEAIGNRFLEVLLAPSFHPEALTLLSRKRNRILLAWGKESGTAGHQKPRRQWRSIAGGALVQDVDQALLTPADLRIVTERQPTPEQIQAMLFAWKVVKHVKSNAVVLVRDTQTVGIGSGQMSRVDASRMALMKARSSTKGCVAASDAFFPFRDGLDLIAEAGVEAVIQPGGSVRDEETIAAANEHGIVMAFSGVRAFRH
jgi:phosphoribosylaminoimidazolecarboxamide formyltransferase/IMP cyclohydrolase